MNLLNAAASFSRISNFANGLSFGAQASLSSSIGSLAKAAGLAQIFGDVSFSAGANFNAFGMAANLNIGAGFLPSPLTPDFGMKALAGGMFEGQAMMGSPAWGGGIADAMASFGQMGPMGMGGAFGLFGGFEPMQSALFAMSNMVSQQLLLGAGAFMPGMAAGFAQQSTNVMPGRPTSFPAVNGNGFTGTLSSTKSSAGKSANAKKLNVSGRHDVKTINKAVDQLAGASAKISVAKPGEKTGPGKLVLTAEQTAAIRNAPSDAAAKDLLRGFVEKQTGQTVNPNMNDKNGIRKAGSRNALNKLLGTKVRNGTEKNSGSSMVMDSMLESITKGIRQGSVGSKVVTQEYAAGMIGSNGWESFGFAAHGNTSVEIPGNAPAVAIDISSYDTPANTVGELYSPLIFDLEGQGLKLKNSGMIEVDLDGDGKVEMVSDLNAHIGLLVFDSKFVPEDGEEKAAGRDMFGNGTDLGAYGIDGTQDDGSFANGFEALRALAEKFELVKGKKQHLDAEDLLLLEEAVGLRMRVGGLVTGEDRKFARLGITRINLGAAGKIMDIEVSPSDAYGNKLMHQEGATFVVAGTERPYADIWFNIQARVEDSDVTAAAMAGDKASTAALLAANRR